MALCFIFLCFINSIIKYIIVIKNRVQNCNWLLVIFSNNLFSIIADIEPNKQNKKVAANAFLLSFLLVLRLVVLLVKYKPAITRSIPIIVFNVNTSPKIIILSILVKIILDSVRIPYRLKSRLLIEYIPSSHVMATIIAFTNIINKEYILIEDLQWQEYTEEVCSTYYSLCFSKTAYNVIPPSST